MPRWMAVFAFLAAFSGGSGSPLATSGAAASESSDAPRMSTAQLSPAQLSHAEQDHSTEVEVRNGQIPGSVEIEASRPIDLVPELIVEWQQPDGSFSPIRELDVSSLKLVTVCGEPIGRCVRVGERGLKPVPWTGMTCSSQCNRTCDRNVRLSGKFRFVVTTCDGKQRFAGPVFEMPKSQ